MPTGLHRYQQEGDDHLITFSCYHRLPYLNTLAARDLFLTSLEATRKRYHFDVLGYVVMPEHVHLLVGEPKGKPLAKALQALKLSVSKLSTQRPFWQARYHDFNVLTHKKRVEKLHYMHRNPVTRGLVSTPEHWPCSSHRYYSLDESGPVKITPPWTIAAPSPP